MIPGLMGKAEMIVKEEDLVSRLGNSPVDVLSTPRLIQLMEEAAVNAIQDIIPPDQLSLGTQVKIKHLSATPLGMKVTGNAILKEVHKNRLLFLVDAYDERRRLPRGNMSGFLFRKNISDERLKRRGPGDLRFIF
jgi:predicted thioesterase